MNISLGSINGGFIGYKAASYENWDSTIYQKNSDNGNEWSGLYIAEEESTACGYLPDMVGDGGSGIAYIHKVDLNENVNIVICLDDSFRTGEIDMDALKKALREKGLDVQDNQLLMPRLGELGYFFKCYNNDEGAIEIIVPNVMADKITMPNFKKCKVKNYETEYCESI